MESCFTVAPCGVPLCQHRGYFPLPLFFLQGAGASSWKVRELGGWCGHWCWLRIVGKAGRFIRSASEDAKGAGPRAEERE